VLLFALIEPIENRLAQRTTLVQLGSSVKAQEAGFEHALALRLEIRVHDADVPVTAEIGERLLLRALPIGEVLVVIDQHRALGGDVGPVRPGGRQQARIAVDPGAIDKRSDLLADRHCYSRFPSLMPPGIVRRICSSYHIAANAFGNFSGAHPGGAYNARAFNALGCSWLVGIGRIRLKTPRPDRTKFAASRRNDANLNHANMEGGR